MTYDPEKTKLEINVRAIRHIFIAFEKKYGKNELIKFIESTGMPSDYFNDENNWISHKYSGEILEALVNYTKDPLIPYKFGLTVTTNNGASWGIIKTIITSFASCTYTYKKVIALTPRWQKVGAYKFINFKKNKAVIQFKMKEGMKQDKNNCLVGQGQFAAIPTIFNLPPAKIKETQCAAEGADSCIYEIKWKNPPSKKTGLYLFLIGIAISITLYILIQHEIVPLLFTQFLILLNIPILIYSLWRISNNKEALKDISEKTEEQNEGIEKNLIGIENFNALLQAKVEEKVAELTKSNEGIQNTITYIENNKEEIVRTGKMRLVGSLAKEIADKLKNPIDTVQTRLKSAIKDTADDDPISDSLAGAKRAADRCENTVNELLSFSMKKINEFLQEIDINKLLEGCAAKGKEETSNPDIRIKTNLEDNLPKFVADYKQVEQVIMIFITNAGDAINEARKKDSRKEGSISISTSFKNKEIIVKIEDTGSGIPKNVISKIYDPFFSTKTTSRRKGMGLTLSFNIIKKLGGRIEVKSEEGKGTTFAIYLPVGGQG